MIHFDAGLSRAAIDKTILSDVIPAAATAHGDLIDGTCRGSQWLGWQRLAAEPNDALLEDLAHYAEYIRTEADVFLCIGIGGSYLGARAVIEAGSAFFPAPDAGESTGPEVLFAGHNLSGAYLEDLLRYLEGRSVFVNVISKSGTTLEPAVAFRIVRQWMEERFEDADRRICVTTDSMSGALHELASARGYRRYDIPGDIGGRFSVLTPVGLLPIAVSGLDIRSLYYGAVAMHAELSNSPENPAVSYATHRIALLKSGYTTEVLAHFEPRLAGIGAWWQQLFGESEGKQHSGIFPSVVQYTTDLHSLGQYMQDGIRNVFETFLVVGSSSDLSLPTDADDMDGLNYIAGQKMDSINEVALRGTVKAHNSGGVPVISVALDTLSEEDIGRCIFFFEHAAAIGGLLLGVNPFDQPGVEAYKKEMLSSLERLSSMS